MGPTMRFAMFSMRQAGRPTSAHGTRSWWTLAGSGLLAASQGANKFQRRLESQGIASGFSDVEAHTSEFAIIFAIRVGFFSPQFEFFFWVPDPLSKTMSRSLSQLLFCVFCTFFAGQQIVVPGHFFGCPSSVFQTDSESGVRRGELCVPLSLDLPAVFCGRTRRYQVT